MGVLEFLQRNLRLICISKGVSFFLLALYSIQYNAGFLSKNHVHLSDIFTVGGPGEYKTQVFYSALCRPIAMLA